MPCAAPSRNNLGALAPCICPDVYAGGICKWHWQKANGLIVPSAVDQFTVLLLHCEGADGSTSFIDSSPSAKAVTASGTAKVSTAQAALGGSSVLLNTGGAGVLTIPDSPDWAFGAGDFTIDFWVRFANVASPAAQVLLSQRATAGNLAWTITWLNTNFIRFFWTIDGTSAQAYNPTWAAASGVWYHVAFVRSGPALRFFINGVQIGADGNIGSQVIFDSADPVQIGCELVASTTFLGNMDEIRISKGIARWTSNFSPPTAPY